MATRLSDIDVEEISLVDIPAIKRKFLIVKEQEEDMGEELTLEDVEKDIQDKVETVEKLSEETEKAGRKLSKTTKETLQSIIKELTSLLEDEGEEVKKEETDIVEIKEYIKEKTKELLKLEK